ncbi:MAG: HD domain-containing protein [Spirochaetaceae bacterium]|nr:MAG: HD domain-containing protein [Spirochaetaceae bacterium]
MKLILRLLLSELSQPVHYVVAVCVGIIFTLLRNQGSDSPLIPFVVPFFVSIVSRYSARLQSRKPLKFEAEHRGLVREFQNEILGQFRNDELIETADEQLAELVLQGGYSAVLFAQRHDDGTVTGFVYKRIDGAAVLRSDMVTIEPETHAPVFQSRELGRAVYAQERDFSRPSDFQKAFPVAQDVRSFIADRVYNLVTYHAGPTSIVAFNKTSSIHETDLIFIESAVDAAHGMFTTLEAVRDLDTRFMQAIHGLCASAEFSDEITGAHIWRVNRYAGELAARLSDDPRFRRNISQVAAAHDIGKVAIPDLIQLPRGYSVDERIRMQMHTVYGAQILDQMIQIGNQSDPRLCLAREIALNHHQRWDGKGYPGLKQTDGTLVGLTSRAPEDYTSLRALEGSEISLAARIVSICDCYDALRSERPYKAGFDHETAVQLVRHDDRSDAGGADRFGPDVYEAFMDSTGVFRDIFNEMRGGTGCTPSSG